MGMLMAVTMSEKLGWLDRKIVDRTRSLLLRVNLLCFNFYLKLFC